MKRLLSILVVLILIIGGLIGYRAYQMIQSSNVQGEAEVEIRIPVESDFEGLMNIFEANNVLKSPSSFRRLAGWMKFGDHLQPGNYKIGPNMSNRQIVNLIRSGSQTPVKITINSVRMLEDAAGKLAKQIEADSQSILQHLQSSEAQQLLGTNPENVLSYLIPNTYEVFWNIEPDDLLSRFKHEHKNFWDQENRLQKAAALELSPEQVYTLASIVERETRRGEELPIVAGLYLNRLRLGIPLQADPTVVFAVRQFDLKRVLNKHLAVDSPYNTYKYAGLPPGPICMPRVRTIDAVLNAAEHDYLYMCAKVESSGEHAFAATLTEHNRNARAYRTWLNENGIR